MYALCTCFADMYTKRQFLYICFAGLVELEDTLHSKRSDHGHEGSTPSAGTKFGEMAEWLLRQFAKLQRP